MYRLISKQIPAYYFLLMLPVLLFLVPGLKFNQDSKAKPEITISRESTPELAFIRQKGFKFIQPLIIVEQKKVDETLSPLKQNVEGYINQKIASGELRAASVNFEDLLTGYSFQINPNEMYGPGSIAKVPVLIAFLKEAETNPSILNKKVYFGKHFTGIPEQHLYAKPLEEDKYYTISELLQKMIVESDNDATFLLNMEVNREIFIDIFTTFGLTKPDLNEWEYYVPVENIGHFLKVLFNSTYLSANNSEYALQLLSQSNYTLGIRKGVDKDITVANKFGERNIEGEQQLHETAIIYLNNKPYLLTVMTKANSNEPLPEIISQISKLVFDFRKQHNT